MILYAVGTLPFQIIVEASARRRSLPKLLFLFNPPPNRTFYIRRPAKLPYAKLFAR
jgi:hypothetical protein